MPKQIHSWQNLFGACRAFFETVPKKTQPGGHQNQNRSSKSYDLCISLFRGHIQSSQLKRLRDWVANYSQISPIFKLRQSWVTPALSTPNVYVLRTLTALDILFRWSVQHVGTPTTATSTPWFSCSSLPSSNIDHGLMDVWGWLWRLWWLWWLGSSTWWRNSKRILWAPLRQWCLQWQSAALGDGRTCLRPSLRADLLDMPQRSDYAHSLSLSLSLRLYCFVYNYIYM